MKYIPEILVTGLLLLAMGCNRPPASITGTWVFDIELTQQGNTPTLLSDEEIQQMTASPPPNIHLSYHGDCLVMVTDNHTNFLQISQFNATSVFLHSDAAIHTSNKVVIVDRDTIYTEYSGVDRNGNPGVSREYLRRKK